MPHGKGYGLVAQGQVGTGAAQVFNNRISETFAGVMAQVKKDHQEAVIQKRLDKQSQQKALTWSSKGFENDLNTFIGHKRRGVEEYYIGEKAAGRDPDDVSTPSGAKFYRDKQETEELAFQSDQWKTTYNTAVNSTDKRFHDVDKSQKLQAEFRVADEHKKRQILEENPDLLVEKPFNLLESTQMIAKDAVGMITRPDGNYSLDPNSGLLVQGITTKPQQASLETAAYEMMREPDVITALEDRGYKTAEDQHDALVNMLAMGKDIKKSDRARTPPKEGDGFAINFNSGGASSKNFNWTIRETPYGQTKTKGAQGAGKGDFYRIDIENTTNADLGTNTWDLGQGGDQDVNVKGKLLTIEKDQNGQWIARIRTEENLSGARAVALNGSKRLIIKGTVLKRPYTEIAQQYETKYKAPAPDEMVRKWKSFGGGAKQFSSDQESVIQENLDANPDYSREEIVKALGY